MGDAAAERAAGADRLVGDVLDHLGEQMPERAVHRWAMNSPRVPDAGADAEPAVLHHKPPERRDAVDVDQMARPRQPERHGGHETLAAGQDAAVLGGQLRQQGDGFLDGGGRVIEKWSGFHWRRQHRAAHATCNDSNAMAVPRPRTSLATLRRGMVGIPPQAISRKAFACPAIS